jgi:hypothetical protein
MRTGYKALLLGALALPLAGAAETSPMNAGRWEVVMKGVSGTIGEKPMTDAAVAAGNRTKFACLSAADARDPEIYFKRSGMTGAGECGAPSGSAQGGRVSLSATCSKGETSAQLALAGTYGPAAFHLDADGRMTIGSTPLTMKVAIDGRHVGACKGDEE